MPSWPAGVQTTTIRFGKGITVGGNMTAADLVVEPIFSGTNAVIWDGDGTPLLPFLESVLANEGVLGSATVPVVDQTGWLDDGQNSYSLWGYKLTETPRYGRLPGRPRTKFVQPLAGQIEIDFDRIPDGSIGLPVSAPVVAVSSVNGQTGAVIVEGMTEDQTAELTAVTEAVEGRLSEAQLNAQFVTFRDTSGNPLARHVIITVNATTGEIEDIKSEAI
jgi:hypothetical protein